MPGAAEMEKDGSARAACRGKNGVPGLEIDNRREAGEGQLVDTAETKAPSGRQASDWVVRRDTY